MWRPRIPSHYNSYSIWSQSVNTIEDSDPLYPLAAVHLRHHVGLDQTSIFIWKLEGVCTVTSLNGQHHPPLPLHCNADWKFTAGLLQKTKIFVNCFLTIFQLTQWSRLHLHEASNFCVITTALPLKSFEWALENYRSLWCWDNIHRMICCSITKKAWRQFPTTKSCMGTACAGFSQETKQTTA